MDSQAIIERINQDVKDKTLLVRFYNLQNGVDLWIDGLCWSCYDFDMKDYLREELGIELWDMKLSYDVLKSDDDFINRTSFVKGQTGLLFSKDKYDEVNQLINANYSQSAIEAAFEFGISADNFENAYKGYHENFVSFATGMFDELCLHEIPEEYREFIDYEKYAESLEQQYYFSNGHVFDATIG